MILKKGFMALITACLCLAATMVGAATLTYTEDLSRIASDSFGESKFISAKTLPDAIITLPAETGSQRVYASLLLGNAPTRYHFIIDQDANQAGGRLFFDANGDSDLTNDGDPTPFVWGEPLWWGKASEMMRIPVSRIPYADESEGRYLLGVKLTQGRSGSIRLQLSALCAMTGTVMVGQNKMEMLYLDYSLDGVYGQTTHGGYEDDRLFIDLNNSGRFADPGPQEQFNPNSEFWSLAQERFRVERIHASGATITFNDSESTGISGYITDAATGAPIAAATAQVMEVTDNLEEMIGTTYYTVSPQSIADGSFTTGVLKDKTCRVLFSAYGYIPQLSEPFTLEAATPKEFEISLRPLPMPISGEATVQKDHGFDFMLQRQVSSTSGDLRLLKQDGRLGFLTDAFLHGTLHPAIDVRHYPLCERPIPASGFTKNFVPAVSGKVYMAQARKGMEGVYIAFKVTQVRENDVTLSYCVILPHALKGRVLSSVNGQPQPVYGAVISIEGSSQKAATDTDGRFYITNVLSGTRDVTIAMAPFESQTLSNIEMEARLTQLPSVSLSLPAALAPEEDLCPDDPFKTAPGECGCGVPDGDEDGDGFLYCNDAFPWDASENRDTDGDLIGDNADTDDDNDGMPDTWEASHQGLNPLADDGSGDIDGDGVTNLDEYKAGTNPTDGLDFPATATPLTPANQAQNQSTTLTLEVERNGQRSQRHRATRWQIFGNQEQTRLTLDLTLTEELLRLRVPELTLVPGHTYYWRARFEDGRNVWSPIQAFTTAASTTDTNANGIPDTQEACRTQEERTKLCDPDLDVEIDLSSDENAQRILAMALVDPQTLPEKPDSWEEKPKWMLAYRAFLDGVGTRATFTFTLKDPVEEGFTWVKYDASGWKELPQELISISEDRREITLTITDGGPGDADGLANGIIVDPFGPMEKAAIPQPDALLDETSCFIRSLFH